MKRKKLDYLLITLMLFNGIGTLIMNFRVFALGIHVANLDRVKLTSYGIADIPYDAMPIIIAAYGIYKRRFWGWVLTLMISAIYLHSMTVLIADDLQTKIIVPMFYIDFYFLAFSVFAIAYLVINGKDYFNNYYANIS